MARPKTAKKTAVSKATKPVEEEPAVDEHDVVLEYSLQLKTADGSPAKVTGAVTLENAMIPAFLADTQKTITDTVEKLVKERFLLQTRHFINTKRQASLPKTEVQFPQEQQIAGALPGKSEASAEDSSFGFESDEPTIADED